MRVEPREKLVVVDTDELREDASFQHAMGLIDAAYVVKRRTRHARAAIRDHFQPPLRTEPVQHLADALARNPENLRQWIFNQLGAGPQPAFHDGVQDRLI